MLRSPKNTVSLLTRAITLALAYVLLLTSCTNKLFTRKDVGPGTPSKFVVDGLTSVEAGECVAVPIVLTDAAGVQSPTLAAMELALSVSTNPGQFFTDASCASSVTTVTVAANDSTVTVYYRTTLAGPIQMNVQDVSGAMEAWAWTSAVVPAPPSELLVEVASETAQAGVCTPFTLSTFDPYSNASAPAEDLAVGLSAGTTATIHTSSACGATVSEATLPAGQSSVTLYVKNNLAGLFSINATPRSTRIPASSRSITILPNVISLTGSATATAGVCTAITATLLDATGAPAGYPANLVLTVAEDASAGLYSNASCTTPITTVTILDEDVDVTFYYKDEVAEPVIITVDDGDGGLEAGVHPLTVGPAAASKLVYTVNPTSVTAGVCSAAFTVRTQDPFNNFAPVTGATSLTLSGGTGTYYSDASCDSVANLSIGAGESSQTFYYKGEDAATFTVTTAATGLTSATQLFTVNPAAASKVTIAGPTTAVAGTCSTAFVITSRDPFNNGSAVTAAELVALTGGSATFYSNSLCTAAITDATISLAQSTATFYMKDTVMGSLTITGTPANLAVGTATVEVSANAASKLVVTGPSPLTAGVCSTTAYTVTSKDEFNNISNVASTVTVTPSGGSGTFYTNAGCSGLITTFDITGSTGTFYYKDTVAASFTLTTSGGGLTAGTLRVTVDPAAPSQLAFFAGPTSISSGACSSVYTVQSKDEFGNVAGFGAETSFTLMGDSAGDFYSDASCANTTTGITYASGADTKNFYYKNNTSEEVTLNVTDGFGGFTDLTRTVTVLPTHLLIAGVTSADAGTCIPYTVTSKDFSNNTANVFSATTVNLTETGAGAFYSDVGCANAVSSVTIASGTSAQTFYFKDRTSQAVVLTATDNAATLVADSHSLNVLPITLVVTGVSGPNSGACVPYTVTSQDANGEAGNVFALTTVTLTTTGSALFYDTADTTCVGSPITSVNIANGASAKNFYYKDTLSEVVTLGAHDGIGTGMTDASRSITFHPASVLIAGAAAKDSGTCEAYTVTSKNGAGATTNVLSETTVALSDSGSGSFFSDAICSGPNGVTSVVISSGTSAQNFYFKDNTAELTTITGTPDANSIAADTHEVTVRPITLLVTGAAAPPSGMCVPYTVTSHDATSAAGVVLTNTTINLTKTGAANFYDTTDTTCAGTPITSVVIASGTSSKGFYFKDETSEVVTLGAHDGIGTGMTDASRSITFNPTALLLAGASSALSSDCVPFTVTTLDAGNLAANVLAEVSVALSDTGAGLFYSDSGCATPSAITSVTVEIGTSESTFYFKDTTSQATTITASDDPGLLTDDTHAITLHPTTLLVTGDAAPASGACVAYTVTSHDATAAAGVVHSATTITLTKTGSALFYDTLDTTCAGAPISSVVIASGTSAKGFYFKDNTSEVVTLGAHDGLASGMIDASRSIAFNPTTLLIAGATTTDAKTCVPFTVTSLDAGGSAANVMADTTVNLTDSGAGIFYSDVVCATSVTSVQIDNGTSVETFYFKDATSQVTIITASDGVATGMSDDTHSITVAPSNLVITGAAAPVAGVCEPYTVTTKDETGTAATLFTTTTINLTTTGSALFYGTTDTTCAGSAITSVSIAAAASSKVFYFRNMTSEVVTLGAHDGLGTGMTDASRSITFHPSKLVIVGTTTPTAGVCQLYTVETQDATSTAAAVFATTTITLTDSSLQAAIYTNSACDTTAGSVEIASGGNSANFYMRDEVAQTFTMTAASTGLTSAAPSITVQAAAASQLVLTASPTTGTAGTCIGPYTVESRDPFGNSANVTADTVLSLTGESSGDFYTAAGCGVVTSSIQIDSGTDERSFYFKDDIAETVTLSADDGPGALTAVSSNPVVISAAAASQVVFTVQPATVTAGVCSDVFTIRSKDPFGNVANVSGAEVLALTDGSTTGVFYSDAGCTAVITSSTIANGGNTTSFYFKDPTAATLTFNAVDSAVGFLTAATTSVTVNPAAASKFAITGSATLTAGTCSAVYTLQTQDEFSNPANPASQRVIQLTGNGAGAYYDDADCTIGITEKTIETSAHTAEFYFLDSTAQTLTLNADELGSGGLTAGTKVVTVGAATPTVLLWAGSAVVNAGACAAYTVTALDAYTNASSVTSAHSVDLTGNGSGSFYSNAGCTAAVTTLDIAVGQSQFTVYFKDTTAETLNLMAESDSAESPALTADTHGVTVLGPALLGFSDGPTFAFPATPITLTNEKTFTVTNSGGQPATAMVVGAPAMVAPFTFKGGSYPGTGGTCATTLGIAPDPTTCTVVVVFSPTVAGSFSETVRISYNDGVATVLSNRAVTAVGSPASGSLDTTFNTTGKVISSLGSNPDRIQAIAVDSDGKIVVGGYTNNGGTDDNFALARYSKAGVLDATFGTSGVAKTSFTSGSDRAFGIGILATGKIVSGGFSNNGGTNDEFGLTRHSNVDGTLDTSFSGSGLVTSAFSSREDRAYALAIGGSNIALAGHSDVGSGALDFAVALYSNDGALDTSFDSDGMVTTDLGGSDDSARAVAVQANGRIIVAGRTNAGGDYDFAVARYLTNGTLDPDFNTTGYVLTDFDGSEDIASGVAIQDDGKIVVVGHAFVSGVYRMAIARYTALGALDTTFNTTGQLTIAVGTGNSVGLSVAIQEGTAHAEGRIVVGGYTMNTTTLLNNFLLVRRNTDGTADTTFDTDGIVTTAVGASHAYSQAIAIQPADGKILVGGYAVNGADENFAMTRYWP